MKTPLDLWEQHVNRWRNCTACELHQYRQTVVLARGSLPADIFFLGEAPGPSEDSDDAGRPFVGPAGNLLDQIVASALGGLSRSFSCCFGNLIACIPLGEDGNKFGKPPMESVQACKPRLEEFVAIVQPKLLVAVGKEAEDYTEPGYRYTVLKSLAAPRVCIKHPAFILRMNVSQQGLEIRRASVTIRNAVERYLIAGEVVERQKKVLPSMSDDDYDDQIPF